MLRSFRLAFALGAGFALLGAPARAQDAPPDPLPDLPPMVAPTAAQARSAQARVVSTGALTISSASALVTISSTSTGWVSTQLGVDVEAGTGLQTIGGGRLRLEGGQTAQAFRTGADLTLDLVVDKSAGRVELDTVGVGGGGSFTFTTLALSDDNLAANSDLTITDAFTGTGALVATGANAQTFTLPGGTTEVGALEIEKASGALYLSPAVPVAGSLTLTSGTLTLGQDLAVTGVMVAAGGTLAQNGHTLRLAPTVSGSTVQSLAAIDGNGSTIGDDVTFERPYLGGEGWRMIASPFPVPFSALNDDFFTQGATGADYAGEGANPILYAWDATQADGSRWIPVADYGGTFEAGRGYAFYAFGDTPWEADLLPTVWDVTGVEHAAATALLNYDASDSEARFSLLGNPYAAPIDWHAVQAAGSFQASYGVWDPDANSGAGAYAYYSTAGVSTGNADRYIPASEGFWAESTLSSPFGLTFDRAWKAPYESPVYVGRQAAVPQLRLHVEGEGLAATDPVALFLDGAEAGEDVYDGGWLRPLSADYVALTFVREDGKRLVFDARPTEAAAAAFSVSVSATRAGTYTLTWPDLPGSVEAPIRLVDTVTGAEVDLRSASSYSFQVEAGPVARQAGALADPTSDDGAAARFSLLLGAQAVATEGAGPSVLALGMPYPNPAASQVTVPFSLAEAGRARVEVFDVLGRSVSVVADESFALGSQRVSLDVSRLPAGTYMVRLTTASGELLSRSLTVAR